MIKNRLEQLRNLMKERNIFAYIIPSSDYHQSEYVGEFFKSRQYISGFTGSAGTVIVTLDEAGLWTDGRYFLQGAQELEGSGVELFKMGEPGVPSILEYLTQNVPANSKIGFDGKTVSALEGAAWEKALSSKGVTVEYSEDLINHIWEGRPSLSDEKAFLLDVKYAGQSFSEKLERVRNSMRENSSTMHVISTLDDIAWLFNIRGRDVKYNPVVLSYSVITLNEVYLFVDENKLNDEIKAELAKENVQIKPYDSVYEFIKNINKVEVVLIDPAKANYASYSNIPQDVKKREAQNPTVLFKAMKNATEINHIKNVHVKDGVAVAKFMYWLKNNVGKIEITELSATEKLEGFRREQEGFIEPSFSTIAGYKDHGAIVHYSATEESNYKVLPEGLLLVDSGGQYYDGTTDITRTFAVGPLTDDMKLHFTSVLRGMIRLSMAKFLYGTRGSNLDILARGPLWDLSMDYNHGTGHGIGFLLNVHEGPNGIRWNIGVSGPGAVLEEGMVTTNEPGFYVAGSHGIRLENELITKKGVKNEFGQFMEFEVTTFAPLDLDAIDASLLEPKEKEYLNNYHAMVFEKLAPGLTEEEREWLKEYTRAI